MNTYLYRYIIFFPSLKHSRWIKFSVIQNAVNCDLQKLTENIYTYLCNICFCHSIQVFNLLAIQISKIIRTKLFIFSNTCKVFYRSIQWRGVCNKYLRRERQRQRDKQGLRIQFKVHTVAISKSNGMEDHKFKNIFCMLHFWFVFFLNSYTSQRGEREQMGKDKDTKSCTTTMNSK